MPGVTVAQRVSADLLPRRDRAQFLSAFLRRLHPAPGCRGMRLYDSALADVSVSQGVAQARAAGGNASFHLPFLHPDRTMRIRTSSITGSYLSVMISIDGNSFAALKELLRHEYLH